MVVCSFNQRSSVSINLSIANSFYCRCENRNFTNLLFLINLIKANCKQPLISIEMQRALSNNAFSLAYQLQVDTYSLQPIGIEVLLRWQHPELGEISPTEVILNAEKNGLIYKIGEWVLKQACMDYQEIYSALESKSRGYSCSDLIAMDGNPNNKDVVLGAE
jgi:predicted signal transduction protein with EAL and GGDEF domain